MPVSFLKKVGLMFSLNDPRWGRGQQNDEQPQNQEGRKPTDGPPDLDQLWRDFNNRINRLFGRRSGGGGNNNGGGFKPDMRGAGLGLGIIAFITDRRRPHLWQIQSRHARRF
jgi:membrane protease subunit HflK